MHSDSVENPVYGERKLLSRMEDDDKKEILYFLEDFKIPATNNQAELDQRNIKLKQKIGKFRCVERAENYTVNLSETLIFTLFLCVSQNCNIMNL